MTHLGLNAATPLVGADGLLLAAQWGEVIGALMAIGIPVVLWLLNAVFGQANREQLPRRAQPPRGQVRPAGDGGPLRNEVDEFLRRVAEHRAEQPPEVEVIRPQAPPPPRRQRVARGADEPVQSKPAPPARGKGRPARAPSPPRAPITADVVEPLDAPRRSLATAPGDTSFASRSMSQEAQSAVDLADERMEAHLAAIFSQPHEGPAAPQADRGASAANPAGGAAQYLAGQLYQPTSLREALVLSEILNRPEHRW